MATSRELYLASALYDSIEDQDLKAITNLLTQKRANPNYVIPLRGIAPFHLVIGNESEQFALQATQLILQHDGDPNVKTDEDVTTLHVAASCGRLEILQLLLDSGGDHNILDEMYKTALDYAQEEGHKDCCNLLRRYAEMHNKNVTNEEICKTNITLDKIIINNGIVEGEYVINNNKSFDGNLLEKLPEFSTNDYVNSWFDNFDQSEIRLLKEIERDYPSNNVCTSKSDNLNKTKITNSNENNEYTFNEYYSGEDMSSFSLYSCESGITTLPNSSGNHGVSINTDVITLSGTPCRQKTTDFTFTTPIAQSYSERNEISTNTPKNISVISISSSDISTNDIILLSNSNEGNRTNNFSSCNEKNRSSSEYKTCSYVSNIFEQNIINLTDDLNPSMFTSDETRISNPKSEGIGTSNSSTDLSFVSVSEVYKYIDDDEGVVLYEKRFFKKSVDGVENASDKAESLASKASSLPKTIDYDTDTLRQELTLHGYSPGPITKTTKRVYLKKLRQIKTDPICNNKIEENSNIKKDFTIELQKTLRNPDWNSDLTMYKSLEETVINQFNVPDPKRKWREGVLKSSFTYILLDPRITNNLPGRADSLKVEEIWEIFLSAIFYVGKGKRARPYSHLYEAVAFWNNSRFKTYNKKLQTILDIWNDNRGVICLHVFQNIIPVEAYTREAAMISALKIDNLCNQKQGDFYGLAATWTSREKKLFGVYLLYKAMKIFLHEGERQLSPSDIG